MTKLLVWVPVSGVWLMMVTLVYAALSQRNTESLELKAEDRGQLVLILKDYEEQVEILMRWLQFRRKWLDAPVHLGVAVTGSTGETLKILERLHRKGSFQLIEEVGSIRSRAGQKISVIRLEGTRPIPWDELERSLRSYSEPAS